MEKITEADLFATSTKRSCEEARQHFIDLGKVEEHDSVRRHPDTCKSKVFGLAEADALWETRNSPRSLLGDMGMTVYSYGGALDTKVVFLTDDSSYGWKLLKERGWMATSFRYRGTAQREFGSWRDHVDHYYAKGVLVVQSVEELLKHLNGEVELAQG